VPACLPACLPVHPTTIHYAAFLLRHLDGGLAATAITLSASPPLFPAPGPPASLCSASWVGLYAVEAAAVMAVLKRFNYNPRAAAREIATLVTPSKKMLPL
jgi:hypothetical protein